MSIVLQAYVFNMRVWELPKPADLFQTFHLHPGHAGLDTA